MISGEFSLALNGVHARPLPLARFTRWTAASSRHMRKPRRSCAPRAFAPCLGGWEAVFHGVCLMPRRAVTSGGSRASTAILECGVLVLVLSAANVGTTCAESQSRLYAAYLRLRAVSMVLRTLFEHGDFPMDFYARFERGSCRVTAVSWHCGTVLTSASSAGPLRRSLHGSSVVCLCLREPIVSSERIRTSAT